MHEQTTYPALLAVETIPAPLTLSRTAVPAAPAQKRAGLRPVLLVALVLLSLWVLKRWW